MLAHAAIQGKTEIEFATPKDQRYLMWADEMATRDNGNMLIARGKVQIVNKPYTLLADEVEYNKQTGIIIASGHVRLVQDTGEMVVANSLNLNKELGIGQAQQFGMLFRDKSRLMARKAYRETNQAGHLVTVLERGTFTSCVACAQHPERQPLWQMQGKTVTRDETDQRIIYHDAWMEMWGVPVFYTPYFSHPDPTLKQKSGFLPPRFLQRSDTGLISRAYYYQAISPSQDILYEFGNATNYGPTGGAQWRRRYNYGELTLGGSFAQGDLTTDAGRLIRDTDRWQVNANGTFNLNRQWRTGFEFYQTSDNNFLRQYGYRSADVLRDRAYIERFTNQSWFSVDSYSFQDLRPIQPGVQPNIVPLIRYEAAGRPGETFGGRWNLSGNFLGIAREASLQDVQRASGTASWLRQDILSGGMVSRLDASVRADSYWVQNAAPNLAASQRDSDYQINRYIPVARWGLSYPLQQLSANQKLTYVITPEFSVQAAPRLQNSGIPNEDSQDLELDASNLFRANRYPGIDLVEDGSRLTYGTRFAVYHNQMGSNASFLFGQSYQLGSRNNYPLGSGLRQDASDWVGQLLAQHKDEIDLDYRFRLRNEDFAAQRHEVNWGLGRGIARWNGTYLFAEQVANTGLAGTREQVRNELITKLNKFWSLTAYDLQNLGADPGPLNRGTTLRYDDECFSFHISAQRDYTQRIGESSGDSFFFVLSFKNLGDLASPTLSPDKTGGGTGLAGITGSKN